MGLTGIGPLGSLGRWPSSANRLRIGRLYGACNTAFREKLLKVLNNKKIERFTFSSSKFIFVCMMRRCRTVWRNPRTNLQRRSPAPCGHKKRLSRRLIRSQRGHSALCRRRHSRCDPHCDRHASPHCAIRHGGSARKRCIFCNFMRCFRSQIE